MLQLNAENAYAENCKCFQLRWQIVNVFVRLLKRIKAMISYTVLQPVLQSAKNIIFEKMTSA